MIKWFEKHNKVSFLIFWIIASFIFYMSSQPYDPVPTIKLQLKSTIYHIGIFFLLCLFLMMALSKGKNKDWLFFAVIFSFFYGISDELHQFLVIGRHATIRDVLTNSVGIIFAFLIYYISIEWRKAKTNLDVRIPLIHNMSTCFL